MCHILMDPFTLICLCTLTLIIYVKRQKNNNKKNRTSKKKKDKHRGRIDLVPIHSVFILSLNAPHQLRLKVN